MRIAYLDCASGISGDMTLGALVDAGADLAEINRLVGTLGLPQLSITISEVKKKGFRAGQIKIEHPEEHKHRHLHHIQAMIDGSALSPRSRELATRIFARLAAAEAKVHGSTIQKVHFHEVGAIDSIADIVGSAIGFDLLGIERVAASAVPTGNGFVEIAHGRCSIPAPATAELLQGIPLVPTTVQAELTTPTGAAILAALSESFGPPPAMTIERIGYGAGNRDLEGQANLLRLMVGQDNSAAAPGTDQAWMLETNLDDISGEVIGHAIAQLWTAGALDVFTSAIQMKKNRPGITLSVLCHTAQRVACEAILFRETTTLGVRRYEVSRSVLPREPHAVETPWGLVQGKLATFQERRRFAPEYESCRQIADERGVPLQDVYAAAQAAWRG